MDQLISTFHIDWKLLIAQAVNFAIVLLVLYKFAYKSILKMLNDRTSQIEKGLKDAEVANKKVLEIGEREKEMLANAKRETQVIISKAEETAKKNKDEIIVEAKTQADKILADAKKKIEDEKVKMVQEVKAEISELVISATEKVLGEKLDKAKDSELIKNALK
ncbi:MAG: F0F1 ATP synthase subunit B [Candidatus Moranbacteria bacterium]|nr:F0F1 ATP synthase subunit B [Candidatus Moranbacteria bacterium]